MDYNYYIEIRADKRFEKPCIKGSRISVYDVLNRLSNGMSIDEILEDFEELTEEQIRACLAFAADKERKISVATSTAVIAENGQCSGTFIYDLA